MAQTGPPQLGDWRLLDKHEAFEVFSECVQVTPDRWSGPFRVFLPLTDSPTTDPLLTKIRRRSETQDALGASRDVAISSSRSWSESSDYGSSGFFEPRANFPLPQEHEGDFRLDLLADTPFRLVDGVKLKGNRLRFWRSVEREFRFWCFVRLAPFASVVTVCRPRCVYIHSPLAARPGRVPWTVDHAVDPSHAISLA